VKNMPRAGKILPSGSMLGKGAGVSTLVTGIKKISWDRVSVEKRPQTEATLGTHIILRISEKRQGPN